VTASVNSLVARKIFIIKVFNIKISSCYIRIICYSYDRAWQSHQRSFARRWPELRSLRKISQYPTDFISWMDIERIHFVELISTHLRRGGVIQDRAATLRRVTLLEYITCRYSLYHCALVRGVLSLALIVYLEMWPVHAIEEHQLPYVKRLPRTKFGCRLCRIPSTRRGRVGRST